MRYKNLRKSPGRLIALLAAIALLISRCNQPQGEKKDTEPENTSRAPNNQQQQKTTHEHLLVGDWVRTDAPYRIQISEIFDDGRMNAGYSNPNPINVSNAEWIHDEGFVKIYIELRDDNYPGSNYNLTYMPERDVLAGEYYQAVEGVTFDVEFVRAQ